MMLEAPSPPSASLGFFDTDCVATRESFGASTHASEKRSVDEEMDPEQWFFIRSRRVRRGRTIAETYDLGAIPT